MSCPFGLIPAHEIGLQRHYYSMGLGNPRAPRKNFNRSPIKTSRCGFLQTAISSRYSDLGGKFWLLSSGLRYERYHRDDPLGLLLVLGELWVERGLSRVDLVAFGPGNFLRAYLDRLSPNFDLRIRMSLEIVIPVRIGIGSSL